MDILDKKKRISSKGLPHLLGILFPTTIALATMLLLLYLTTMTSTTAPRASSRSNEMGISVTHFLQKNSRCQGRYIYVYPLPPEFNEGVVARCLDGEHDNNAQKSPSWNEMCGNLDNLGLGPLIPSSPPNLSSLPSSSTMENGSATIATSRKIVFEPEGSWYRTEQFTLEVFFHHRIKTYECLTPDPTLADAFYIPYYAGLDVALNLFTPHTHLKDRLGQRLIGWLSGNLVWRSSPPKRQFMALGRITWDLSREDSVDVGEWGSSFLYQPEMANVTKLIIERKSSINTEIGIPYPTPFHPSSHQQIQSWQEEMQGSERKWLVTFVGSPQRSQTLREALMRQCKGHPRDKCRMVQCGDAWSQGIDILRCVEKAEEVLQLFSESIFCLQPGGDSPTRKSMFDSLLAGCIPVLFSNHSAYKQYPWHLPVHDPTSWSVFYPEEKVLLDDDNDGGGDVISFLERIDSKHIKQMQETIIGLIPRIIYAKKPWPRNNYYSEDIKDAFDIAIENVLQNTPIPIA